MFILKDSFFKKASKENSWLFLFLQNVIYSLSSVTTFPVFSCVQQDNLVVVSNVCIISCVAFLPAGSLRKILAISTLTANEKYSFET